ncbi:hypothetical protein HMPREF0578_0247 [Mobiluncus mulieris 28-1]|uniref:hypothetical protein n=1 Tax=Mobiluncus mulieris TaxID=2052 RepID=UPI0001BE7D46|nr:hypothetical protein [Mobiluncus mulieris]EEZ90341.1 hypothetical protein HMPREF0578_0247 [Mobiluncus mulieris 28-1]
MSREVVEIPVHELHVGENVRQNLRAGDLSDSVEKMGVLTPRTWAEVVGAVGFGGENGCAHALVVLPGFTGGVDYP